MTQANWRTTEGVDRSPDRESSVTHDGEGTGWKSLMSSHRTVEPGVPQLVMPAQPVLSKYTGGEGWSILRTPFYGTQTCHRARRWLHNWRMSFVISSARETIMVWSTFFAAAASSSWRAFKIFTSMLLIHHSAHCDLSFSIMGHN